MEEITSYHELKTLIESGKFQQLSVDQCQEAFLEGVRQAENSLSASNGKCLLKTSDLECFQKFAQYVAGQDPKQATHIIVRLLGLLCRVYKFSSSNSTIAQNAKNLQSTIFSLLSTPPDAGEDCLLVLDHIWPLTEHMTIQDAVDIWKKFVFLISKFKPIVSAAHGNKLRWDSFKFQVMVKLLNKQIINNIKNASNTTRTTKISCVYVTILDKFRPICPKNRFPAQGNLCDTIITIFSLKHSSKDATVQSDIEQILPVYINFIHKTYSEPDFIQNMLNKTLHNTPDRHAFFDLSMQIIKWALVDKTVFEQYTDLFTKLMVLIPECEPIFYTQNDFYKTVVEHLSAFMFIALLRGHKNVETTMVTSVLQDNFWLGMIAADLWALLAKSITENQCMEYCKFWAEVHEELLTAEQPSLFVNVVLQHLFSMLSTEADTMEPILTLKPVSDYPALWAVLRLDENADLHAEAITKTIPLMEDFLNQSNAISSKSLRKQLALVGTRPIVPTERFKSKLLEILVMVEKNQSLRSLSLVVALIEVTLAVQTSLSNEEFCRLFQKFHYLNTTLPLKVLYLRLIAKLTMGEFDDDMYRPKISSSVARILVCSLDEGDELLRILTLEVLSRMPRVNIGRHVLSAIFLLKPTFKSVLADYSNKTSPVDITEDRMVAFLEGYQKPKELKHEASKETNHDFEDDQLIAGYSTDMLCTSTQKRANPGSEEMRHQKKAKLKEECNVDSEIESMLTIAQRVKTKRLDADISLSTQNFDKISQIINVLKNIK